MHTQYSPLQKMELTKQRYIDTQDIHLLVCMPQNMHCIYTKASLQQQLHQSFEVITVPELASKLTNQISGIVLLDEDLQLLSTALMQMADALNKGSDFITANIAYGPDGQTECFYNSRSFSEANYHCCLLSRALLEELLKQNGEQTSVDRLIQLAARVAAAPKQLEQILFLSHREIQIDDLFYTSKKRALILCHEFSMTGAPIVLVNAVPVLASLGFEIVVLGPSHGPALALFQNAKALVVTNQEQLNNTALYGVALNCDFVLANTICEMDAVKQLDGTQIPVLWWLHDAYQCYPFLAPSIPAKFASNVCICAVGSHATAAIHSVRPKFQIDQLIYGLPDYAQDTFDTYDLSYIGKKRLFITVGSFEPRKGQDILCQAIRLLPADKLAQCAFLFIGKGNDLSLYAQVEDLVDCYPNHVFYRESLTRDEIKSLMQQCFCVICSSRDDPMPTFITEGLIFGRPVIVSEYTGTAGLIQEGKNGFIYRENDPAQLSKQIEFLLDHPELAKQMSKDCRSLYEHQFTYQSFERTLKKLVQDLTHLTD